jgi:hypothetical protein
MTADQSAMKRLPFVERCKRVSGTRHGDNTSRSALPFVAQLRQTLQTTRARQADPWRSPLERVRGKVGDDGVERISTQSIFDMLDVAQRSRGAGACRRLAKLMRELGWAPIKARGLTRGGFRDQVRGYARDLRGSPLA